MSAETESVGRRGAASTRRQARRGGPTGRARARSRPAAAILSVLLATVAAAPAAAGAADLPAPASVTPGATTSGAGYTVRLFTANVRVGVNDGTTCPIEAEIYRPAGASAQKPVPAVMTTNGFGGTIADQRPQARALAAHGYAVLNYSGLGWGRSGCKVYLDDPEFDGKAASRLVSLLGGARVPGGMAPIDWVTRDTKDHDGTASDHDPRVGMIGGSYGGGVQFAAAKVDPRVDTLIPIITWSDLNYSLAPNGTDYTRGVTSATPGALKVPWSVGFFALGIVDGLQGASVDLLGRTLPCPSFVLQVCEAVPLTLAQGTPTDALRTILSHDSVASYVDRIRIPTLLAQGEHDTLFNLNESVATYDALRDQGTPVKLLWQSWGHSRSTPAPGESDLTLKTKTYEGTAFLEWFDHYLKDNPKAPSLDFTYFRPWRHYTGDATPAYGRSAAYPPRGRTARYELSADGTLQKPGGPVRAGDPTLVTTAAGLPTSYTSLQLVELGSSPVDTPGTSTAFTSAPVLANTDVVGLPRVTLRLNPGLTGVTGPLLGGPLGQTVVFVRLEDVGSDGAVSQPTEQVAAVRVPTDGRPVTVTLPGIVHRFAAGHRIRLVVAGGDLAYRGGTLPTPVNVSIDPGHPSDLHLPVVPDAQQGSVVRAAVPPAAGSAKRTRVRPRISRVRLTSRRLSMRVSTAATVHARVQRRVTRHRRRHGRTRTIRAWRTVRTATLRSHRAQAVRRRIRRLPAGRYRVRASAVAQGTHTHSRTTSVVRRVGRAPRR